MASMYDPAALTGAQRWSLLGASLRDIGASLNGDGESGGAGGAVAAQQALIAQGQTDAADQAEHARNADAFFSGDDPRSRQANFLYKSSPKFRDAYAQSIGQNYRNQVLSQGQEQVANDPTQQNQYAPITYNQGGSVAAVTRDASGAPTLSALGQIAPGYDSVTKRSEAENRIVTPGSQLVHIDGTGDGDGSTSVSASVPAAPVAAPGGGAMGGTRGDRNNNPGNVKTPPQGMWQGQTGVDSNGYAVFDTPANGQRALGMQLAAYGRHGITTPDAFVERYAPDSPAAEKASYKARIAGALGSNFNLNDPATVQRLMPVIAQSEGTHLGGGVSPVARQTAPATPTVQAIPGASVLYSAPAKPVDTPTTITGPAASALHLDPTHVYNGKTLADLSKDSVGNIPEGNGPDLLKKLQPAEASTVQQMLDGRLPVPSGFALSKPYWQRLLTIANQVDPSFDAGVFQSRAKTRSDYFTGKTSQNIKSLNTAIGHLGSLADSVRELHNGSLPVLNAAGNFVRSQSGDSAVNNAAIARDAVATELATAFKGGVGSLKEVEDWQKRFPLNGSPQQQNDAIAQGVDLLHSRLSAVQNQVDGGMGKPGMLPSVVSPKAQLVLNRLEGLRSRHLNNQQLIQRSQQNQGPAGFKIVGVN